MKFHSGGIIVIPGEGVLQILNADYENNKVLVRLIDTDGRTDSYAGLTQGTGTLADLADKHGYLPPF